MLVSETRACEITLQNMQHLHPYAVSISFPDCSRDYTIVVRLSDASFRQEHERPDGVTQNVKSQQAGITALELGDALNTVRMLIQTLTGSLTGITRVCHSSLMVEAYILSNTVEQGLRTRGVVFDIKGQLNSHQTIDLSALKQLIWDNHDDCCEVVDVLKSYYSRRVDTSTTLSDCLSKTMTDCRLDNTSRTDIFDTRPTEKSTAINEKNRKWRSLREKAGTTAGL